MRVALAIDDTDWHARALLAAFSARHIDVTLLRLSEIAFDSTQTTGLRIPGFENALPTAMLVRAISAGTFEEVTRRLGVLHALRELGVPVWNDARAIERCVDKSTTSFLLDRAGIATIPTWTVEGREAAVAIVARETKTAPLVMKPLFGSQGKGLRLLSSADELPPPEQVGGVYYLQRYVRTAPGPFRDHRLFVCAGHVLAAMTRESGQWITNVHLGAKPMPYSPSVQLQAMAVRATAAVGAVYAGVDIIHGHDGRPWVLEVNSMPGWKGLQRVSPGPIAQQIVDALVATLP